MEAKARKRLNILKALAGTSWGQSKETIIATYNALIETLFTFCAPIWYPNASPASIERLQAIQNEAMRIATGCHKMSAVSHLHQETQLLPVDIHLGLLCRQFLASALQPNHPSHAVVTRPVPPPRRRTVRLKKPPQTLRGMFLQDLGPFLEPDGTIDTTRYKATIRTLHTQAVQDTINTLEPNRVLNARPPAISQRESRLPRHWRTVLAQLRSSHCHHLRTYQHRIGAANDDLCPGCGLAPHSTAHLFNCPNSPTDLTPRSLWCDPASAVDFLCRLSPFLHLDPPPPRPPPQPD